MPSLLQIVDDPQGGSRFVDVEMELRPDVGELLTSRPADVSAAWVFHAPPGSGHPQQPEARRQLAVLLSGSCTVTVSSGETRTCRPGDLLLVEDTDGLGHSSTSDEGATILMIALEKHASRPFLPSVDDPPADAKARR